MTLEEIKGLKKGDVFRNKRFVTFVVLGQEPGLGVVRCVRLMIGDMGFHFSMYFIGWVDHGDFEKHKASKEHLQEYLENSAELARALILALGAENFHAEYLGTVAE